MASSILGNQSKKKVVYNNKDTVESLKDLGGHVVKSTAAQFKRIGRDIFDQFFARSSSADLLRGEQQLDYLREAKKTSFQQRKEFSIFSYQQYYEQEIVKREIRQLTEQIRKEIELIKKADASLLQEVRDVEKMTLDSLPSKPGIYHIRFFEIILTILRSLRAKIGESKTWLSAMVTKRKKRGSLFLALTRKKGTKYSLSQELQSARAVQ